MIAAANFDESAGSQASDRRNPGPSATAPEPDDSEELFELGERIADLAARINAAEGRMLRLLADFDRRGGWRNDFSSCAEWLAWRTGTKIGPARERVRAARALETLPRTADALRAGQISYSKVRAISRVATPETEAALLDLAQAASAARLEQRVRMWRQLSRDGELAIEEVRHRNRAFSIFVDGDGMYVVKGRLEPEVGAVLMRAVEAAADALYRQEGDGRATKTGNAEPADPAHPKPKQRRADAVGLVAERALAAGFGDRVTDDRSNDDTPEELKIGDRRPDESGTRAERYQVVIHTDSATLAEEGEPGRSDLDGVRVSAETSRRLACDAATVTMRHDEEGSVVSVGRKTRTIPPHIRRALDERDRGCRFPGCASRFTEAHHVRHWADGGETSLRNLLLLCRRHHRTVHEGRVKVSLNRDGTVLFITRGGRILVDAPRRPGSMSRIGERMRIDGGGRARAGEDGCTKAIEDGRAMVGSLPPIPAEYPAALSNGAALYRDSAIPWAIEAAAREAVEESG